MMKFADAPLMLQGIAGIWAVILLLALGLLAVIAVRQNRKYRLFLILPLFLFCYIAYQCTGGMQKGNIDYAFIQRVTDSWAELPALLIVLLQAACTGLTAILFVDSVRWNKTHITAASVKEAMDFLPAGICWYDGSGRIILKNIKMEALCRMLTGEALLDANAFLAQLETEKMTAGCRIESVEEKKILLMPDGCVYSLSVEKADTGKVPLFLMLASDITEEYRKTQKLTEQQQELQELNKSLAAYNKEIIAVVTAREILNAKIKIHDEMGSGLLAAKRFLSVGGNKEEWDAITGQLKQSLAYLTQKTETHKKDEYLVIMDTAEKLNAAIVIEGRLPEENPYKHIAATAMHECLTNMMRHADGDELTVQALQDEDRVRVSFTNNGRQPENEVVPKGGLAALKSLTEQAGGKMSISVEPRFSLTIELPKEENNYGIQRTDCR